jgi:hypothetical protein
MGRTPWNGTDSLEWDGLPGMGRTPWKGMTAPREHKREHKKLPLKTEVLKGSFVCPAAS